MANLLLLEDHLDIRLSLQRLLQHRGHNVFAVGSIDEAQVVLAKLPINLLITDIRLPRTSPLQLQRFIEQAGQRVWVIAISGDLHTYDAVALLKLVDSALSKPLLFPTLLAQIETLVARGAPQRLG